MPEERSAAFVAGVDERSDGNFLYLFHFLNAAAEAVDRGATDLAGMKVPDDLDEIYRSFAMERIRRPLDVVRFTVDRPVPADLRARWLAIEGVEDVVVAGDVTVLAADGDSVLLKLLESAQAVGLGIGDLQTTKGTALGTWEEKYLPLLGVLGVAFDALTRDQLAAFAGVEAEYVDSILAQLLQFLDTTGAAADRYRIYHRDFAEYLLDRARNRDWPLDGPALHDRIASACLERCRERWDECDEYARTHACVHLAEAGRWQALSDLVEDPLYLLAADPNRLLARAGAVSVFALRRLRS